MKLISIEFTLKIQNDVPIYIVDVQSVDKIVHFCCKNKQIESYWVEQFNVFL